ncbi:MAG: HEAT repeat domain-containing protein [Candidatus Brocadiia bacterium]
MNLFLRISIGLTFLAVLGGSILCTRMFRPPKPEPREIRIPKLIAQIEKYKGMQTGYDWDGPLVAARELAAFDAKEALPVLVKFLKDGYRVPCCCGSMLDGAIIKLGGKAVISDMLELLKSPDDIIRSAAVSILGGVGAQEAIPEITKLLSDPYSEVRGEAVYALMNLKAKESAPAIKKLLSDPEEFMRYRAQEALKELGVPEEKK